MCAIVTPELRRYPLMVGSFRLSRSAISRVGVPCRRAMMAARLTSSAGRCGLIGLLPVTDGGARWRARRPPTKGPALWALGHLVDIPWTELLGQLVANGWLFPTRSVASATAFRLALTRPEGQSFFVIGIVSPHGPLAVGAGQWLDRNLADRSAGLVLCRRCTRIQGVVRLPLARPILCRAGTGLARCRPAVR